MKKRILALFLACVTAFSLLPAVSMEAKAVALNETYNTGNGKGGGGGALISDTFTSAYVRNKGASAGNNGTARYLELVVSAKALSSAVDYYAIVLKASDYTAKYPNGPRTGGLDMGTYHSLTGLSSNNHYAMARKKIASATAGQKIVFDFVAPSAPNHDTLGAGGTVGAKQMPLAGISGDNYFDEYVLVVFSENREVNDNYYVDHFYVDHDGYVRTPSYMVAYNTNNPQGTSNPYWPAQSSTETNASKVGEIRYQIQRAAWNDNNLTGEAPGTMALKPTAQSPSCIGYEFVGWTTTQQNPLAEGAPVPTEGFYAAGADLPQQTYYSLTTLYALWRTVPVKFSHQNGTGYTVTQEGEDWIMDWAKAPQVGVPLNSGNIIYEQPDGSAKPQPDGVKTFRIVHYQGATELGTTTSAYNDISVGRLGNNHTWGFIAANGPKNHTYKADGTSENYRMVITVTDPSNNTSDTITVRFPRIEKRQQPVPTKDDNTGLQSQIETVDGGDPDGQIFGFYSGGPKIETDEEKTGYLPVDANKDPTKGTYGTGTMTGYYLNLGMVYEYRPKTLDGVEVSYAKTPGEGDVETNPYATMPNDGWREVPFPSSYYTGTGGAGTVADVETTMTLQAKAVKKSTKLEGKAAASLTDVTGISDAFQANGWEKSYGSISFNEAGLPVIHGLKKDDVYEIRFRANATSAVSPAVEITIGGAVASSGTTGGGGLAVNLVGGKVADDPATTEVDELEIYNQFVAAAAAMTTAGTLQIPNVIPVKQYYQFAGWTTGEFDAESGALKTYPAGGTFDYTPGDKPVSLAAVWNATTEGFMTLTLFDWDSQFIGSKTIAKVEDATTQEQLVTAAFAEIQTQYATTFTSHAGYDFGCWIPYSSSSPTVYGAWVDPVSVGNMSATEIPQPSDALTATDVTGDMQIKAVYTPNAECTTATEITRWYSAAVSDAGRFSTDYIYPITFKISRGTAPRAVEPALRLEMSTNGVTTYSLFNLTGADEEYVQIALFADFAGGVDSVTYTVVDIHGQSNWKSCGVRTNVELTKLERGGVLKEPVGAGGAMTDVFQDGGYPRMCIVGSFNNALESYAADTSVPIATALSQIGLPQLRSIGISCSGISTIRNNLYREWRKLNTIDGTFEGNLKDPKDYVDLEYEDIKTIVGGGTLSH